MMTFVRRLPGSKDIFVMKKPSLTSCVDIKRNISRSNIQQQWSPPQQQQTKPSIGWSPLGSIVPEKGEEFDDKDLKKYEKEFYIKFSAQENLEKKKFSLSNRSQILSSVFEHENKIESGSIAKNIYNYNVLLNTYTDTLLLVDAEKLLEKMKKEGVEPNLLSYQCLIFAYIKTDQFEKAEKIFDKIVEEGKPRPTYDLFYTFFKLYIQRDMDEKAIEVALNRSEKYLTEDETHQFYVEIIKLFNMRKKPFKAEKFITNNLWKKGIYGKKELYHALIDGYNSLRLFKRAESIPHMMKYVNVEYDATTFHRIMLPHAIKSDYVYCQKYMDQARRWGVKLDADMYALISLSYIRIPYTHYQLDGELYRMDKEGVKPNSNCFIVWREFVLENNTYYETILASAPQLTSYLNKFWEY